MTSYNKFPKGSEWRKWDLHFHTTASYDYQNKSLSEKEIIDSLSAVGISVVAITDHHEMNIPLIKKLQQLGEAKGITVLPGIEFLSDARGRQPIHFIGIFSETCNMEYVWGQIQNKTSIHKIIGEGKKPNEVYCDLNDTLNLINKLGGISSIHAGEKSNSIENITHSLPHGEAQKTDIAQKIDIYELGKEDDQDGYRSIVFPSIKKVIPMIICSDNHDAAVYVFKQSCWIKADPTFEGLKQIIYEPEDRVKIQAAMPEVKAGYQVIDKILIQNDDILNDCLELNPNLNSIIGGRSTGKSILLGAIAKKLKSTRPIVFADNYYGIFIKSVSDSIKIIWKDGKEEDNREVEYFHQGYMHEIAKNNVEFSRLIRDILFQKGKEPLLLIYETEMAEISKRTNMSILDFYQIEKSLNEKNQKLLDKGDLKGVEVEIEKLEHELKQLNSTEIIPEEKNQYEEIKNKIEINEQNAIKILNNKNIFESLKSLSLFKDNISLEINSLSEDVRIQIDKSFQLIKSEIKEKWLSELSLLEFEVNKQLEEIERNNNILINEAVYIKVSSSYKANFQLSELEEKIKIQRSKLFEIKSLSQEIRDLDKQHGIVYNQIKKGQNEFYKIITEVIPKLSDTEAGLEIKAKENFNLQQYQEILYSSINQQSYASQSISNFNYTTHENFIKHIFNLLDKLITKEVTLKGGNSYQSFITRLYTTNFYEITYDLEYEGDDFRKMSDGKKAFVILKLLLEFSNKDCPILIDQPEDDLDNRSIYNDLVQYLIKKKKLRQIILATHNPNIVVGADSELVICANQHGVKNRNRLGKKFQYVSGSLEHAFEKNSSILDLLEAQGTREHVCEVLEGGNTAFKLREKKYSIKQ